MDPARARKSSAQQAPEQFYAKGHQLVRHCTSAWSGCWIRDLPKYSEVQNALDRIVATINDGTQRHRAEYIEYYKIAKKVAESL